MIRRAVLIKRTTDDGLVEIKDHIALGKVYQVEENTIRMAVGLNTEHNKPWLRLIVDVIDDEKNLMWFPTELLRIE